jgi:hypothetical protein
MTAASRSFPTRRGEREGGDHRPAENDRLHQAHPQAGNLPLCAAEREPIRRLRQVHP